MPLRAPDDEVLLPLREDEEELDGLLARARAAAEQTIEQAEASAQALRAEARRALAVEIQTAAALRAKRREAASRALETTAAGRVTELRELAAARRDQALALVFRRVLEVGE